MEVRILIGPSSGPSSDQHVVEDHQLRDLYSAPSHPWLRVNMVATLDGAAQGDDGRSGGVNNDVDKRVFDALRDLADCVVVGAGTARAEGYRASDIPLVLVSRSGEVPEQLRDAPHGKVLLATTAQAPGLDQSRSLLGDEHVWVLGDDTVDLALLKQRLADRGWNEILSEGGPRLLRDLLAAGVADEVCLTTVPRMIAGEHLRITHGDPVDVALEPALLLEENGTLLGRWIVKRSS